MERNKVERRQQSITRKTAFGKVTTETKKKKKEVPKKIKHFVLKQTKLKVIDRQTDDLDNSFDCGSGSGNKKQNKITENRSTTTSIWTGKRSEKKRKWNICFGKVEPVVAGRREDEAGKQVIMTRTKNLFGVYFLPRLTKSES